MSGSTWKRLAVVPVIAAAAAMCSAAVPASAATATPPAAPSALNVVTGAVGGTAGRAIGDISQIFAGDQLVAAEARAAAAARVKHLAAVKAAAELKLRAEARARAAARARARARAREAATRAAARVAASAQQHIVLMDKSYGADAEQETAASMLARYGWSQDQMGCLQALWGRESGWNAKAYNAGSGAYGIPQALPASKMASAGADWQTDATTQIKWGLGYIKGNYGSPCGAWGHEEADGWY